MTTMKMITMCFRVFVFVDASEDKVEALFVTNNLLERSKHITVIAPTKVTNYFIDQI